MIRGLGVDVVEVARIRRARQRHGARFLERVYTSREIADCQGRADPDEGFAARFAAKEAALKALGTGWSGEVALTDAEVRVGPSGAPSLALHGGAARRARELGAQSFWVSLTHTRETAAAVVVLEATGGRDEP